MWTKLFYILIAAGLIWWLLSYIRHQPGLFSRQNLSKSFFTMGILALILIAFVVLCIIYLRH